MKTLTRVVKKSKNKVFKNLKKIRKTFTISLSTTMIIKSTMQTAILSF